MIQEIKKDNCLNNGDEYDADDIYIVSLTNGTKLQVGVDDLFNRCYLWPRFLNENNISIDRGFHYKTDSVNIKMLGLDPIKYSFERIAKEVSLSEIQDLIKNKKNSFYQNYYKTNLFHVVFDKYKDIIENNITIKNEKFIFRAGSRDLYPRVIFLS